jgi:hypothetical protein
MKKIFFIVILLLAFKVSAQIAVVPSYPTIKLTKLEEVGDADFILATGVDARLKKINKNNITAPNATTTTLGKIQLSGDLGGTATSPTVPGLSTKENTIAPGTTSQYWRGDKTWQTLNKVAVGLGNVDNTTDANKPVSTATQTALNLKENTSSKNVANGYAGLGADGKLISNQLPAIAITDTYIVNTQASMLALSAETGDVAIRTDLNKSYILQGTTASVLSNWQELLSPTGATTSVFGRTGSVVANAGDYNTSQVTESGNLYYTDARVNANANVSANTAARHNAVTIGTANGLSLSTQALSLGLASSTSNGALSSTDWTTFNNKIGGSGTTNYLSKFTASGTIGNSQIFDNGTNVGIGTTSPTQRVDIVGSIRVTDGQYRFSDSRVNVSNRNWMVLINTNLFGDFSIKQSYSNGGDPLTSGTDRFYISPTGNVGIGTTSPSTRLDVNGAITASGGFLASSDRRLKNIISRSGDMIKYTWKDKRDNKTHFGYVAQDVRKKMPDQVNRDEQGYMSVNYIEVLVAKVNALELEVQSLKEKLK